MTQLISTSVQPAISSGDIMGEHNKTFPSFGRALDYLRRNPFGTIEHPDMDQLAFLYMKNDGSFAFVDVVYEGFGHTLLRAKFIDAQLTEEEMEAFADPAIWDQKKFSYLDGTEMACRVDGIAWFDSLRADLSLSPASSTPSL